MVKGFLRFAEEASEPWDELLPWLGSLTGDTCSFPLYGGDLEGGNVLSLDAVCET